MYLNFVDVIAPRAGRRWTKAQATLEEESLVVSDRRGNELLRLEAVQEILGNGAVMTEGLQRHNNGAVYRYADVVVMAMPGACSCGGMRTSNVQLVEP